MKKFFRLVSMLAVAGLTFAYTSCTDYSEDINKVDGRVDDVQSQFDAFKSATNESIEKINGLIADLKTTVATLETKEDHKKDFEDLNKLIGGLTKDASTLKGRVDDIEKDLPNYVKKADLNTLIESYLKAADATTVIGKINGRLEVIEGKLNPLADKYDSELKISEIKKLIDDVTATAKAASNDVISLRAEVTSLQNALKGYYDAGTIDGKFDAVDASLKNKLDIAKFKEEFDKYFKDEFKKAFKTAIEESCKKDGAVYTAINNAVSALDAKITNLDTKLNEVLGIVLDRIQSIVFVPEFDDMNATLHYYNVKGTPVTGAAEEKIVDATFEIYPAVAANKIKKENVSIVAVAVGSRANAIVSGEILGDFTPVNGRVKVTAKFGKDVKFNLAKKDDVQFAISLRVKVDNKEEKDGTEVETTVNEVESAFVGVKYCNDSDLAGKFGIVKQDTKTPIDDATLKISRQWSDAPAAWNYFDGYEFAVKVGDNWLDLDAAAVAFHIDDVKAITPTITVTPVAAPASNMKFFNKAVNFSTLEAANIAMDKTAVDADPENAVKSKLTHNVSFSLGSVADVIPAKAPTYTIIRRQVDFNVTPQPDEKRIAWTYEKALELSSAHTEAGAYDQSLVFNECNVDEIVGGVQLSTLLGTPVSKYVVDDVEVPVSTTPGENPIEISKVSEEISKIAKVTIPGKKYQFRQGEDHECVIVSKYIVEGKTQTEYNVKFTYTLGAMPLDQVVTLPAAENGYEFKAGQPIKVEYEANDYLRPLADALVDTYFKNEATLWASVNDDAVTARTVNVRKCKRNGTGPEVDLTGATTNLNVSNASSKAVSVVIDRSDIVNFEDKFRFETTRSTWYGVDFTFKTDEYAIAIKKPRFTLKPALDRLNNNWEGTILHENKFDMYLLKQNIDLSKYLNVEPYAKGETALTIAYKQLTQVDATKGIDRVPQPKVPSVDVLMNSTEEFPTIGSSLIDWLTSERDRSFTGLACEIEATLKYDGIDLDTKTIKLSTACPIKKFEVTADNKAKVDISNKKVNLWSYINIEGVLESGNVVNTGAASLTDALSTKATGKKSTASTYDCKVKFCDLKDVEVFINGTKQAFNTTKFEYKPEDGTIEFKGDLAELANDVEFRFKGAELTYVLDYNHVQKKVSNPFSVTFSKN